MLRRFFIGSNSATNRVKISQQASLAGQEVPGAARAPCADSAEALCAFKPVVLLGSSVILSHCAPHAAPAVSMEARAALRLPPPPAKRQKRPSHTQPGIQAAAGDTQRDEWPAPLPDAAVAAAAFPPVTASCPTAPSSDGAESDVAEELGAPEALPNDTLASLHLLKSRFPAEVIIRRQGGRCAADVIRRLQGCSVRQHHPACCTLTGHEALGRRLGAGRGGKDHQQPFLPQRLCQAG